MAFSDNPIIDDSSKHCEQSEIKLRTMLNQKTGFICRSIVPDIGCDFDVELILDNKGLHQNFGIQLKSVENLKFIENGQFISYSFPTSRLGYLIRRQPAMGMILIYSVEKEIIYFDYVDEIYNRLLEERSNDEWKDKNKVNIWIPVANLLDGKSVLEIHSKFIKRFEQNERMLYSYGYKYDLPAINVKSDFKYDINNIEHIKEYLIEYGFYILLKTYNIKDIYNLIKEIPSAKINSNKDLQLIAAITYCKVGLYPDSKYYINKISNRNDLSKEELEMIRFTKLETDLALGNISQNEFIDECEKLAIKSTSELNKIILEINLIFYKSLKKEKIYYILETIEYIEKIYKRIENLTCDSKVKNLLEIWNTDNLSISITNIQYIAFSELEIPIEEREKRAGLLFALEVKYSSHLNKLNKIADKTNNKFLKAHIIAVRNRFRIAKEIGFINLNTLINSNNNKHKDVLFSNIALAQQACNIFLSLGYKKAAYNSLCDAWDLIEISQAYYKYDTAIFDLEELLLKKAQMEKEFEFDIYQSAILNLLQQNN